MTHEMLGTSRVWSPKTLKTPAGSSVDVLHSTTGSVLDGALAEGSGRLTIVVHGGHEDGVAMDILGGIWDAVVAVVSKLKEVLSCTPVTTTTVNVGSDGKVSSVVTTTTCVSS